MNSTTFRFSVWMRVNAILPTQPRQDLSACAFFHEYAPGPGSSFRRTGSIHADMLSLRGNPPLTIGFSRLVRHDNRIESTLCPTARSLGKLAAFSCSSNVGARKNTERAYRRRFTNLNVAQ